VTPAQAFVEGHFSLAEIGGVFWSAVGSGASHCFSSAKKLSAREKRRRRFALPAQSKKCDKKMS
jgi:hypothetical protein